MKMVLVSWLVIFARGAMAYGFWKLGGVARVLACVEGLSVLASVLNEIRCRDRDRTWGGVAVPVLYFVSACVPIIGPVEASRWWWAFAVCITGRAAVLLWLGSSYTSGGSTWVGLADSGPYRLLRHPQALLGLLARLSLALCVPTAWNFLAVLLGLLLSVLVVLVEERFLASVDAWRGYSARVQWRLVPGVW